LGQHIHLAQNAPRIGQADVRVRVADVKQGNHLRMLFYFIERVKLNQSESGRIPLSASPKGASQDSPRQSESASASLGCRIHTLAKPCKGVSSLVLLMRPCRGCSEIRFAKPEIQGVFHVFSKPLFYSSNGNPSENCWGVNS
jgi:hypothetical protein